MSTHISCAISLFWSGPNVAISATIDCTSALLCERAFRWNAMMTFSSCRLIIWLRSICRKGYLSGIVQFLWGLSPRGSSNHFHRKISYLFRRGCRWRQCIGSISTLISPHSAPAASAQRKIDGYPSHSRIRKQPPGISLSLRAPGKQRSLTEA